MNERVNIHDIPFADRFKGGKMYESLDDLAHLINMEAAAGDKIAQKATDHHTAASIQQDEYAQRWKAMNEAGAEVCTNFAAGRMESPKMDALPAHDRKEVVEIIVEAAKADLAERKAAEKDTEPMEYSELIQAGIAEGILLMLLLLRSRPLRSRVKRRTPRPQPLPVATPSKVMKSTGSSVTSMVASNSRTSTLSRSRATASKLVSSSSKLASPSRPVSGVNGAVATSPVQSVTSARS